VYSARTITSPELTAGVAAPVLRSELDKLKDTTNLSLTFSVATDGSSNENVVCPKRMLRMVTPALILYENFDVRDVPNPQMMTAGGSLETPRMTIRHISGPGESGIMHNPSSTSGPGFMFGYQHNGPQHIELDLKFSCRRVTFSLVWLDGFFTMEFFDSSHFSVGRRVLRGTNEGGPDNHWIDFSAPLNTSFSTISLETSVKDWLMIDTFTFYLT
jgi:hypothetical protein